MKDEDLDAWRDGEPVEGGIRTAVEAYCRDRAAAKALYGPIASWDTSEITVIHWLFHGDLWREFNEDQREFNEDISPWDVGRVRDMEFMFNNATAFNQQLGGSWATSTADKWNMFYNSPGTIVGMTKDNQGTPR